jgi:hypothetical protein
MTAFGRMTFRRVRGQAFAVEKLDGQHVRIGIASVLIGLWNIPRALCSMFDDKSQQICPTRGVAWVGNIRIWAGVFAIILVPTIWLRLYYKLLSRPVSEYGAIW